MSYIFLLKKNNANTTLNTSLTTSQTSVTVASPSTFPTTGTFVCTIWNKTTYPDPSYDPNMEIIHVTGVSGSVFTIVRAQESTTAKTHSIGDNIELLLTQGQLTEYETQINAILGGTANTIPYYNSLGALTTSSNFNIDSNLALTAYALCANGAYFASPTNPIPLGQSNNHYYSAIFNDDNNNGTLRIFAQSPGNYWNFLQTDNSGNWCSRMTMGDPIDGTVTFSSAVWQEAAFIIGGYGGGFGNSYMRLTTNNAQGVELGDALGGQINVNNGTVFINSGYNGGESGSNQIFVVYDNSNNISFQINSSDSNGAGDWVQTLANVLDNGQGQMAIGTSTFQSCALTLNDLQGTGYDVFGTNNSWSVTSAGTITATQFVTNGGTSSQFVKGDGSLDGSSIIAKFIGSTSLTSGTKAITLSGLTTSNHAFVQLVAPTGTLGVAYKAVCTTNTLTITAVNSSGTTVSTDTSQLNYVVY